MKNSASETICSSGACSIRRPMWLMHFHFVFENISTVVICSLSLICCSMRACLTLHLPCHSLNKETIGVMRWMTEFQESNWINSTPQSTHNPHTPQSLYWNSIHLSSKEIEHYVKLQSSFISILTSYLASTRNGCRADAFNFHLSIISFRMRFGCDANSHSLHMFNKTATGMASDACHHALAQHLSNHIVRTNFRLLPSVCLFARCHMRTEINWNE